MNFPESADFAEVPCSTKRPERCFSYHPAEDPDAGGSGDAGNRPAGSGQSSGLILVTGATDTANATTLAAMVDYINSNRAHHILTVEDPIEFIHPFKRGVVNQRQVGTDTLTYANALRGALRQDPDVIMIGNYGTWKPCPWQSRRLKPATW